ncbi:unknown [Bacteroides sp. CAG:770]|nr:unknown [Bacteroides sp. CAG:770]
MGKSTCAIVRSVVNITGSFQCRLYTRPSPVTGTGLSNTCADRWRGQAENFDPLDRRD